MLDNQWQVDFNLSLDCFGPHIAGVRDLIELPSESFRKPPILFTPGILAVSNWSEKHPGKKVPEPAFHDFSIPTSIGYAESKNVAERMLEAAADHLGVSSAIYRVGQVAGSVEKGGVWSKQEWQLSVNDNGVVSTYHKA